MSRFINWRNLKTLVVARVEKEDNYVVLYSADDAYRVFATLNCSARVGDTITYEPYNESFGFWTDMGE